MVLLKNGQMVKVTIRFPDIRHGVCYPELVFKRFPSKMNEHIACSAVQLFLSDVTVRFSEEIMDFGLVKKIAFFRQY